MRLRPDYNVIAPVIKDGTEKVLSVVYGSSSWILTLRAEAVDPNSLRWQWLSGSGTSVPGSTVRFLINKGAEARVVHETQDGIQQRDQFSVPVSSAGGSDVITVFVVPVGESLPSECKEKGLTTALGDGTRDNPYLLSTLCQLQDVDSQRSAYYRLAADIDASASRGWNGGLGFVPVGENLEFSQVFKSDGDGGVLQRSDFRARKLAYAFSGSFDGAGFLINGLVANRRREDFVGLFSITSEAEFRNVQLLNSEINGREGAGSLAGVILGGTLRNFRVTGAVKGRSYVGGLAGLSQGDISNGYTTGPVSGRDNVGGLVGWSLGGVIGNGYATGAVSGNRWVGSLVGDNWGRVDNSYASGEVRETGENGRFVGGLLGDNTRGSSSGSFLRTTAQLRCPTGPGQNCQDATSYVGWSEQDWHFGDRNALPAIRAQLAPP